MAPAFRPFVSSAQARARQSFPDLRLIVRLPDGSNRTVRVPDPRAAVAAAYESNGTGTTCRKPSKLRPVIIVETPDNWHPTNVNDLPPNVEVVRDRAPQALAAGFNAAELENPKRYWAIDIRRLPKADAQADVAATAVAPICSCHRAEG